MNIPRNGNNTSNGASILSVLVVFMMIASAMVIVIPDANEGAVPVSQTPDAIANHIVISEVFYDSAIDEMNGFIELYNPTGAAIDITGWYIDEHQDATPDADWVGKTFTGSVPAYGFYLIGEQATLGADEWGYTIASDYNLASGSGIIENGPDGWILRDDVGTYVDALGAGYLLPGSADEPAQADAAAGNSYERLSGATHVEDEGNGWDTDDNTADFFLRAIPNPQNTANLTENSGGSGEDTIPPELDYAISTGVNTLEAHFNEDVNTADVETLSNWMIVGLSGFDTVAPYIVECIATSTTSVEVTFSETVNVADANNIANYEIVSGLPITNAVLDTELTTVNLTTNPQTIDQTYTLLVSWINDTANPSNVIDLYSQASFNGGGGGGTLTVVFIDVEQGDCTLIISPTGEAVLYDGGDTGTGAHILSVLSSYGVTDLKYTFASHYHEDHIGAMDEVISGLGGISHVTGACFDRGGSYASSPYDEYESAVITKRMTAINDDVWDLGGGATMTCVAVNGNGLNPSNENDKAVVMRLDYQNFQMYLAGDLSGYNDGDYTDVESSVAVEMGQVEVYQVDHHGSEHSSNEFFLETIDPVVSVFSVGNNGYGHVDQSAFDRVLAQGSYMYYTNTGAGATPSAGEGEVVNGDIELNTDGYSFDVEGDVYQCHDQSDTTSPTVLDVRATDLTHVELTFSESINLADAQTVTNYAIDGGIGPNPSSAILQPDLRTVNLTTGAQTIGITYNIVINNIRDRAVVQNTIATDTTVAFTGGLPTLEILSLYHDGNNPKIVYFNTSAQARIGYSLYAFDIRDLATTPNNQPSTNVDFVGGGYHLTINEVYADAVGVDDDNEWWEIYNPEPRDINLKSWMFRDDTNQMGLPAEELIISQGEYSTMAINGLEFYRTYGFYPDFEIYGSTASKDMSYSGSYHTFLGNSGDVIEMSTSSGGIYDAVVWGSESYGTVAAAPAASTGSSLERTIPGREGPEDVNPASPTGADEQSERQNLGDFHTAVPSPQTLDSQPPQIENVHWDIGSEFAVIYWNTTESGWPEINPESDTEIVYSTNPDPDAGTNYTVYAADMVTEHGLMLYPLTANTNYYFYIKSTDGKGQVTVDKNGGAFYQFTTALADSTAPVISNVQSSVTDTTATITWDTDEISTSIVNYDEAEPLVMTLSNQYLTTSHSILLSGLTPSTSYLFSVSSINPTKLMTTDDNSGSYYQFTTGALETMNFYRGDMDSFTSYSSGTGVPSEAYDYANGGSAGPGITTDHIVISEVLYDDDNTDDHEFVELYNPTNAAIDISGWDIVPYNGNGFVELGVMTIPAGQSIASHGYYLIAQWGTSTVDGSEGGDVSTNWAYSISGDCDVTWVVMQNGPDAVLLRDDGDVYVDAITWGTPAGSYGFADEPFGADISEGSLERMSGSVHVEDEGNAHDTDDNSMDLRVRKDTTNGQYPQPQNTANATESPVASSGSGPDIEVLGINDYSYQLTTGEYTSGKFEEVNKTVNGDFIALYGQQLWDGDEGFGQISVYDEIIDEVATGDALVILDDAYQWVIDHQAIGIFNEPGYLGTFDDMAYDPAADEYMNAMEILAGYRYYDYEYYYNLALRNGWHVGALGGQRNDMGNWGNVVNDYNKIDMTMFIAPDLTTASITDSLRNMKFYAYEADTSVPAATDPDVLDPIFLNYSINGYEMGQDFIDTSDLNFKIELNAINTFEKIEVLEDGIVISTWSDTPSNDITWEFNYTPSTGHHYYYVRGNQDDTESSNFWSSPIWVYNPALRIPEVAGPMVESVQHSPGTPTSTDDVIITADIKEGGTSLESVSLYYSIDMAPYSSIEMLDNGVYPDSGFMDGIYSAKLDPMADGTNVHYYVSAVDGLGQTFTENGENLFNYQQLSPFDFYSFIVGPHLLINEIYPNAYDPGLSTEQSEFIELYNPTGVNVDMGGWMLDVYKSDGIWGWPAGSIIGTESGDPFFVITQDAMHNATDGGYRHDTDLTAYTDPPHWEIVDGSDTYDDPATANMTLIMGDNEEFRMSNTNDIVYLRNEFGTVVDMVEFGSDYSWVPGRTTLAPPENCSLVRDIVHSDTDDCLVDFTTTSHPTPGVNIDTYPVIHNVTRNPMVPNDMESVVVTANINNGAFIGSALVKYSINGGAYASAVMSNIGGDLWSATISGLAAGTIVSYYVYAEFLPGISDTNPVDDPSDGETAEPPERTYSYTVWSHIVISEIYYNSAVNENPAQNSKFIELYNPTTGAIDISGWTLVGEPTFWTRGWEFPAGATITAGGTIVIAKTAGDAANTGFFTEFGFDPDFEMYDSTNSDTYSGLPYSDYDNPGVPNMIVISDSTHDDQIWLGDYDAETYHQWYYDAIYLYDNTPLLVDAMEYGVEGESVPGSPATDTEVGSSLSRDELATDTDDSSSDFYEGLPSPGVLVLTTDTFDIPILATPGWNFVSYPLMASGSPLDVLDDNGGDTTWNVIKWYDPTDANDPWKTYRVGAPLNDLGGITNAMGFWIYITDPGSDNMLTIEGSEPISTTIILNTGWNLVSYPSATSAGADVTLFGTGADMIAVFQAAAPYVADTTDLSSITMSAGNAYWVHVSADTSWVVNY